MRTVDQFIEEARLVRFKTLRELNTAFSIWLEEGYNHHRHSALTTEDGTLQTPAQVFNANAIKLRFISMEELRDAFMWEDDRVVRKDGWMAHDMYLIQVKTPAESKGPWDYYKVLRTLPADLVSVPLSASSCPLVKG